MRLRFVISLFLLTIYKCDYNCIDITPTYETSCVLSDQDLKNSSNLRYCCYIKYDLYKYYYSYPSYNYEYETSYSKCMPYNVTGYNAVKYMFENNQRFEYYYNSNYKLITHLKCNYRQEETTNKGDYCDEIEPEKASDCKFSNLESRYNNNYCCYVKDSSSSYPYCKSYTKSEVDSKTSSISNYYSTSTSVFVCTSSNSYIKISILIFLSLLL